MSARGKLPAALSVDEIEQRVVSCANRARTICRKVGQIKIAEPVGEGAKTSTSDREVTRRRTQLIAIDVEIKALRHAGELAAKREGNSRLDRMERTAKQIKAARDGVKREEAVH